MKIVAFVFVLTGIMAGNLFAKSAADYKFGKEKSSMANPIKSIPEKGHFALESKKVQDDVNLILSSNSRLFKRSSQYRMKILSDQINWEYRWMINLLGNQQQSKVEIDNPEVKNK